MYQEVRAGIQYIVDFLEDRHNDFSYELSEKGTVIEVFPRNGDAVTYHGYDLYLLNLVTNKLNSKLEYKVVPFDGYNRFTIQTDAEYNLMSYINKTNHTLHKFEDDLVHSVYVCTQLTPESQPYNILTALSNGNWLRYEFSQAELLYAAVNNLEIAQSETGAFVYPALIELNHKFYDELEIAGE